MTLPRGPRHCLPKVQARQERMLAILRPLMDKHTNNFYRIAQELYWRGFKTSAWTVQRWWTGAHIPMEDTIQRMERAYGVLPPKLTMPVRTRPDNGRLRLPGDAA